MNALWALAYLWVCSAKNRVRARLQRLRRPKYLVGGIVGALYLGTFLLGNLRTGFGGPRGAAGDLGLPSEWQGVLDVVGAWMLLGMVAALWLIPSKRAALDFSEAEIQFLFPAPLSRRALLRYKLASGQAGLLFGSLMASLFSGRLMRGDGAWMALVGWWMVLLVLRLHSLGASFVRTRLLDRGVGAWRRRWIAAAAFGGVLIGALVLGWREAPPPPVDWTDAEAVGAWALEVSRTRPISDVLRPFAWISRLVTTRDASEFVMGLGFVVVVVAVHYAWVMRAAVAFEEASVEAARAAVEARAAWGRAAPKPGAFGVRAGLAVPLAAVGPPWVAIAWKNLASVGGLFRGPWFARVLVVGLAAWAVSARWMHGSPVAATVGIVAAAVWAFLVVMGPAGARLDLRQDLAGRGWEVLRSLPLPGWQVVVGEMATPWGLLSGAQAVLALLATSLIPAPPDLGPIGFGERAALCVAMGIGGSAVSLLGLGLQNASAVWFPAWIVSGPGGVRGGFEVLGQQLLVYIGQMLALVVGLIPAAIAGGVGYAAVGWLAGPWLGAVACAACAGAVLAGETAMLVMLMGVAWDRADFSAELGA